MRHVLHRALQRPLWLNTTSVQSNMLASSSSALDLPEPAPVAPCATDQSVRVMEPYAPPSWSVILVMIWGTLMLEPGQVIQTDEEWRALLPSHCWHVDQRPYKQTYAMSLVKVESFTTSIGYATIKGQRNIAKYRPRLRYDGAASRLSQPL